MSTETNTIPDNTYINTDSRYGGVVKVTVDDYRDLNPEATFWSDDDGIYEVMSDGSHQVAVSVWAASELKRILERLEHLIDND